ncbi:MAG: hypothetical protein HYW70_01995 [Candidatus Nealsonbacteria bacterium]|nr:hypothetical protein [Candidatus Nealsonbacteria bacterium]
MEKDEVVRNLEVLIKKVKEGVVDPGRVSLALNGFLGGFQHDKTRDGWELVEDVGETKLLSVNELELAPFLLKRERSVNGEELVTRSKKMQANLGQLQAEYLLDRQDEIPKEWRKHHLHFPGTIWRDRDGDRNIFCLCWGGRRWYLMFRWLDDDFDSGSRLLCPRE